MNDLLPITQLLYSSWILSAQSESDPAASSIPSYPGVLDHALREVDAADEFPVRFRGKLHFVEGSTGLNCLELPQIQKIATEAKITADPNPSYTRSQVVVSPLLAKRCIARIGISESEARRLGAALRAAVSKIEEKFESAI